MKNPFSFMRQRRDRTVSPGVALVLGTEQDSICVPGYTSLDRNPEVLTACRRIAELIGSITIHLMSNTASGDVRITNELSRMIDITPMPNMTRKTWMEAIVMNLLLYGRGNSVVLPHTERGYLRSLEPISAGRVSFVPVGASDYYLLIDGRRYEADEVLHFVFNPDRYYLWQGRGVHVSLKEVADNLKQAGATKKGFLASKWKPSIIVKVDAGAGTMDSPEKRKAILEEYVKMDGAGQPWIVPAEQISVEQIRPLTLADLAISDTVEVDKRTVAAVLGVPPFLLGVGEYTKVAWNAFVQNTVRPLAVGIAQEMTRKLILSPDWYLKFNILSLMDWDIKTISDVFGTLSDRGFVSGNEVRDRLGMSPVEGLDEYRVLENYIPIDMSGLQKKLLQGGGDDADL